MDFDYFYPLFFHNHLMMSEDRRNNELIEEAGKVNEKSGLTTILGRIVSHFTNGALCRSVNIAGGEPWQLNGTGKLLFAYYSMTRLAGKII